MELKVGDKVKDIYLNMELKIGDKVKIIFIEDHIFEIIGFKLSFINLEDSTMLYKLKINYPIVVDGLDFDNQTIWMNESNLIFISNKEIRKLKLQKLVL